MDIKQKNGRKTSVDDAQRNEHGVKTGMRLNLDSTIQKPQLQPLNLFGQVSHMKSKGSKNSLTLVHGSSAKLLEIINSRGFKQ